MLEKLPPKQKVYEAYSALADGRVDLKEDTAEVFSSDRSKSYEVKFAGDTYSSTDSATYWQGYPGYPVIAVLILQKRIRADETVYPYLAGIPWKALNDKHKRDYDKALEEALQDIDPEIRAKIDAACEKTYGELINLNLTLKRGRKSRPKTKETDA